MARPIKPFKSHGTGELSPERFAVSGTDVVLEPGVLVFHPENIRLGSNIYIGHYAILNGYHNGQLSIGDNSWIGPQCFLHGAGGLEIGSRVGLGPAVRILTSFHAEEGPDVSVLYSDIRMKEVVIEDDCDLGIGTTILPGVRIGRGSVIGAGAVVTRDVEPYSIMAGVPARLVRRRG